MNARLTLKSGSIVVLLALIAGAVVAMGRLPLPEAGADASLWLVFLTGLSVGGLSCLAVQGGLLAALVAQRELPHQAEAKAPERPARRRKARAAGGAASGSDVAGSDVAGSAVARLSVDRPPAARPPAARPPGARPPGAGLGTLGAIGLFLVGRTVAYTGLGAVLGLFGSRVPISLHGWMLIAAGVFMVLAVMQLYDVHPALRRLTFTPPKSLQRLVRRQSRRSDAVGPVALGAATVFIPCGVTVGMEVLAVATHSPWRGAGIMLAFTLGTVPLFLLVGATAAQLGRTAAGLFRPLAAVTVVIIALVSVVSGARLLGHDPLRVVAAPTAADVAAVPGPAAPQGAATAGAPLPAGGPQPQVPLASQTVQEATIQVMTGSYLPASIAIRPGVPTRLHLVTYNTRGCIRAFVIPSLGIERMLPATGTETIDLPAVGPGRIDFMCSMGMYAGAIFARDPS